MNRYETALANANRELEHMSKVPVYFAQAERQGEIKIGFSTQVENRLYHLGHQRFTAMSLLGWVRGGPQVEREMHAKFAHLRIGGEWFKPGPDLLEFIASSTRHDEPVGVISKYGRISDSTYNSLISAKARYTQLLETVARRSNRSGAVAS
jgi:hypothetical protein